MENPETQTTIEQAILAPENIERSSVMIRGLKVILDKERIPSDYMFRLTKAEKDEVVTNCEHLRRLKFSPALPIALTEHGEIMAAMVLNRARPGGQNYGWQDQERQ